MRIRPMFAALLIVHLLLAVSALEVFGSAPPLTPATGIQPAPTPQPAPAADELALQPAADAPAPVFLPILMRKFRPQAPMLGVALEGYFNAAGWQETLSLQPRFVRRWRDIAWRDVEPNEGDYRWDVLAGLEEELRTAEASSATPILNVQMTPEWAQKIKGNACGPIAADKFEAFATFMEQLVLRYGSNTEFGVRYWQIGNEPDVLVGFVSGESVFGCWGDHNDPYYGGGYYGEMLKVVYPRIKAADPQAQVMMGGLLLGCDPYTMTIPTTCSNEERFRSGYFFEGILKAGGGDFFDIADVHSYGELRLDLPSHMSSYYSWSPAVGGTGLPEKVGFVRRLLEQYGYPNKAIMATELALKCHEPGPACEEAGSAYIPRVFAEAHQLGLAGTVYYALITEFKYKGLLLPDLTPKPQYQAFRYLATQLSWAEYVKPVEQPGISGSEFNQSRLRRLWIVWSSDGTDQLLTPPADFVQAFDKYGNVLSRTEDGKLVVGWSPIYLFLKLQNE